MKKFLVDSIQEGWEKINSELGENAIIINIKEIDNKLEIIAASPVKKIKEVQKENILDKLQNNFKTEEDIKNLEELLNFIVQVKNKSKTKIDKITKHLKVNLENYLNIDNQDLITEKIIKEKFNKKFITVLGGIATGKTTTIAKIASILKFNLNRKIAIASFDFYKIGGFDNLKKFAEIMQIPFFPIRDEKEIISYKDSLEHYDHIIFDTPGNLSDLKDTEKLINYIALSSNSENILTISLDKKESIIKKEIEYFSKFNISHSILTKYDQLDDKEDLFITLSNIPFKVSYISNGLRVPKDIIEFESLIQNIEVA